MQKVQIGTAKALLAKAISTQATQAMKAAEEGTKFTYSSFYLHSSPGIGKSSVVKQITEEMGAGFVDVRLATMEQADVCGIPYVHYEENGKSEMRLSIPDWFPSVERVKNGDFPESGIVFFDELSNAPISTQHAAYRIILDREVQNGVRMAPGWICVAAGNLKTDKTGVKGVAPALANRFGFHLEVAANSDDFLAYAVGKGLNKEVIGFIASSRESLYQFDPTANDVAFATPRSWEQVSNLLDMGFTDDELPMVLAGCVGEAQATKFMTHRRYYEKLPDFEKIMLGEEEYTVPTNDAGLCFAVTSNLITLLMENYNEDSRLKNLEKVMTQLHDDFLILLYKAIKNSGDKKAVPAIAMGTAQTFRRVSPYVTGDKDD